MNQINFTRKESYNFSNKILKYLVLFFHQSPCQVNSALIFKNGEYSHEFSPRTWASDFQSKPLCKSKILCDFSTFFSKSNSVLRNIQIFSLKFLSINLISTFNMKSSFSLFTLTILFAALSQQKSGPWEARGVFKVFWPANSITTVYLKTWRWICSFLLIWISSMQALLNNGRPIPNSCLISRNLAMWLDNYPYK